MMPYDYKYLVNYPNDLKNLSLLNSTNRDFIKEGLNKNEIQWKKNRAVFFSRIERETWHSYEGDGMNTRIALVFNLMTNDIKSVCKIEKKNFFYSFIRFKLNPYIYRYLNKTI